MAAAANGVRVSFDQVTGFERIAEIAARSRTSAVLSGAGESDCAVLRLGGESLVVTSDFINSSPAIVELNVASWYQLGRLLVAHNVADLVGAGAKPLFFLSNLTVMRDTNAEQIFEFTEGVSEGCLVHGCALVGGDLKFGDERAICGTAIGTPLSESGPFTRGRARPGYSLVASTHLGDLGAAVVCLGGDSGELSHSRRKEAIAILERAVVPNRLSALLAETGAPCAGTDISDGLGVDVDAMARSSGVAITVNLDEIPVSLFARTVAAELGVWPWAFAFALGGDFATVFATPPEAAIVAKAAGFATIGSVDAGQASVSWRGGPAPPNLSGHKLMRSMTFADHIIEQLRFFGSGG